MASKLLQEMKDIAKARARSAKLGKRRPEAVRRAISRTMQGKSNFEGHRHTRGTKDKMHQSRGRDDQGKVGGTHWFKPTAYTSAKPDRRAKSKPQSYEPGR